MSLHFCFRASILDRCLDYSVVKSERIIIKKACLPQLGQNIDFCCTGETVPGMYSLSLVKSEGMEDSALFLLMHWIPKSFVFKSVCYDFQEWWNLRTTFSRLVKVQFAYL